MKSNREIASLLWDQIDSSKTYSTLLDDDQADAMEYYRGEPYGNEEEGTSQAITREVFEAVEWALPGLLRPFTSGTRYVQFDAVGPEDEEAAEQETDVVNHIIMRKNNGFKLFYDWFKNALLHKNGYVKVNVEKHEVVKTESYKGLSDFELGELLKDDGIELIEHEQRPDILDDGAEILVNDIKLKWVEDDVRIVPYVVPNEEIIVHETHSELSLQDCTFCAHKVNKTVSQLIEEGVKPEIAKSLPDSTEYDEELKLSRDKYLDDDETNSEVDESQREKEVYVCYARIDVDEDGISELREITISGQHILNNEEVEAVNIATISPYPMPNEHVGISEAEVVMDIQLQKSVLKRQMLDNLYLTNNPEKEVVEKNVNMDDLLESLPGGIKRVDEINSIREITVPFTAGASFPFLELLDQEKESRTGVSRTTMGLNADAIAQGTKGAFLGALDQANLRQEIKARLFAETGVKELFMLIHKALIKYRNIPMMVKLRGEYHEIDPSQWRERSDMTIMVGLGTGNRDAIMQRLLAIAEKQEAHLAQGSPIVTPKNIFNTYERLIEISDLKDVNQYFTDPDTAQPQQEQPDPTMVMMELQKQIEDGKLAMEKYKADMDGQVKMMGEQIKQQAEIIKQQNKLEGELILEDAKHENAKELEGMKVNNTDYTELLNGQRR